MTQETPFVGPRFWTAAIILTLALLFQLSLAHLFAFRTAVPSAVLVAVVWYSIRVDARRAAIFGLIAGLCEDIFAMGTGGAWTVSTTVVAVLAGALSRDFFADSLPIAAVLAAIATLVRNTIFWGVMSFEGFPSGLGTVHVHQTLWQAVLNAILITVAMLIVRRWEVHPSERIRDDLR
jgi:rod shape-determining protein MreD